MFLADYQDWLPLDLLDYLQEFARVSQTCHLCSTWHCPHCSLLLHHNFRRLAMKSKRTDFALMMIAAVVLSSEAFIPAVSIVTAGGSDQNASPSVAPFSSKEAPENQEVRILYGCHTHQVCSSFHKSSYVSHNQLIPSFAGCAVGC